MIEQPMRGVGPRVMISFAAQQSDKAGLFAQALGANGCRVTLESAGEEPTKELNPSLGDVEVFVQLRATDSGSVAAWLNTSLKLAIERKERDLTFVLVPVALEGSESGAPFGDWVYIDASPQGLGWPDTLDLVARTALSAVHALPISKTTALEFDHEAMTLVLDRAAGDNRRIICDSEDILLASAKKIVERAQTMEGLARNAIFRQQDRFVRSFEDQLLALDVVLRKLVTELHAQHQGYSIYDLEFGDRAARSIDRFSRLALWRSVKRLSEWATYLDDRERELFSGSTAEVLERIATHSPGDDMHGLAGWALGPRPGIGADEVVEVDATSHNRAHMKWYLHRSTFGSNWQNILQVGTRPSAEITRGDWLDFVLSQIAFRAWEATGPRISDMADDLEMGFAWRIEDYDTMVQA